MGRDSGVKKRENIGDEYIVLSGGNDFTQTQMEIVVVALRFPFIPFGPFDPSKRFCRLGLGSFGLLFGSSFGTAFAILDVAYVVKSHESKKLIFRIKRKFQAKFFHFGS